MIEAAVKAAPEVKAEAGAGVAVAVAAGVEAEVAVAVAVAVVVMVTVVVELCRLLISFLVWAGASLTCTRRVYSAAWAALFRRAAVLLTRAHHS